MTDCAKARAHWDAILNMRMAGQRTAEIAEALALSKRAVKVVIDSARGKGDPRAAALTAEQRAARQARAGTHTPSAKAKARRAAKDKKRYATTRAVYGPRPTTPRPCMTCAEPFPSEGNHNRMCVACRAWAGMDGSLANHLHARISIGGSRA